MLLDDVVLRLIVDLQRLPEIALAENGHPGKFHTLAWSLDERCVLRHLRAGRDRGVQPHVGRRRWRGWRLGRLGERRIGVPSIRQTPGTGLKNGLAVGPGRRVAGFWRGRWLTAARGRRPPAALPTPRRGPRRLRESRASLGPSGPAAPAGRQAPAPRPRRA